MSGSGKDMSGMVRNSWNVVRAGTFPDRTQTQALLEGGNKSVPGMTQTLQSARSLINQLGADGLTVSTTISAQTAIQAVTPTSNAPERGKRKPATKDPERSEEHTSELQSPA